MRLRELALFMVVCYTAVFSVVTQRSSPRGGALRDDAKNGCVTDYLYGGNFHRCSSIWFAYLLRSILPESNERLLVL